VNLWLLDSILKCTPKIISEDSAKLMENLSNVPPLIISLEESDWDFDVGNDD
jgi:hypothetical protein